MSLTTGTIVYDQWVPLGQTIKTARIAHGWPQRKFARMAGISFGYLGFIETAKCPPPSDMVLMNMAELLEIPPQSLFAMAGRLPPDVTSQFWAHPGTPPILSAFGGMSLPDAMMFCAMKSKLLPVS